MFSTLYISKIEKIYLFLNIFQFTFSVLCIVNFQIKNQAFIWFTNSVLSSIFDILQKPDFSIQIEVRENWKV